MTNEDYLRMLKQLEESQRSLIESNKILADNAIRIKAMINERQQEQEIRKAKIEGLKEYEIECKLCPKRSFCKFINQFNWDIVDRVKVCWVLRSVTVDYSPAHPEIRIPETQREWIDTLNNFVYDHTECDSIIDLEVLQSDLIIYSAKKEKLAEEFKNRLQ